MVVRLKFTNMKKSGTSGIIIIECNTIPNHFIYPEMSVTSCIQHGAGIPR